MIDSDTAEAEDFFEWLERSPFPNELKDRKIIVVGITGKEVSDNTKADLLNKYLGKKVFIDRSEFEDLKIDVYFSEEEGILWLLFSGLHDDGTLHFLFTSEKFKGKSFFEKMALLEAKQANMLNFAFHLCHAILLVEQGCRFDVDWIRVLKQINKIRTADSRTIRTNFNNFLENLDSDERIQIRRLLGDNARIALPRLLVCFYRNPLRNDLNHAKKKELLEKMEKCLECQIANLLKQHGITENRHVDDSLGQTSISSGTPFVYIFNHSEMPTDISSQLALSLFPVEDLDSSHSTTTDSMSLSDDIEKLIVDITELKPKDKENLSRSDYNFEYFLHTALGNIRKGNPVGRSGADRRANLAADTTFPTIQQFIRIAKFFMDQIIQDDLGTNYAKFTPELSTLSSLEESAIKSAFALYMGQLKRQPEITGGGEMCFSKVEHEYTLDMTLDFMRRCCPRAAGELRREELMDNLREQCKTIWQSGGHQRCEQLSLTGQLCHFKKHDLSLSDKEARSRSKDKPRLAEPQQTRKAHCSGVKTYSMCNCGLTRRIRIDPFLLKEANFDFYMEVDYTFGGCCAQMDKYEFHLFDPSNVKSTKHPFDDSQNPTTMSGANVQQKLTKRHREESEQKQTRKGEDEQEMVDDNEGINLAIDPSEFNVRFFDNRDGEVVDLNKDDLSAKNEPPLLGLATQEEGVLRNMKDDDEESPAEREHEEEDVEVEGEEEDEEKERRRRELPGTSAEESTDEDDDEEEENDQQQDDERPQGRLASVPSSRTSPETVNYLDNYDMHLGRRGSLGNSSGGDRSTSRAKERVGGTVDTNLLYEGQYLDHVPHTSSPHALLPLFPSFSVLCIGHSSTYNHSTGIKDSRFRNGSEFLLPWNVDLVVKTEQWIRELQFIGVNPSERTIRNLQNKRGMSKERVKLFIGFDYECPRGHRFMVSEPGKTLKHRRASGQLKLDAATLVGNDFPIWMPCPCKKEPRTSAQLTRIHVVTPKAPVSVALQPLIQMPGDDGFFFPGSMERIELGWAKYYVMRLPYAYVGPDCQPTYRPSNPEFKGKLLRNCIIVNYLPLSE